MIENIEPKEDTRDNGPTIIHESGCYQGFGSECKEYLGIDLEGRFYYGLEIGEGDLCWDGPYETRAKAQEGLDAAFARWDELVSQREQAWEDRQIALFEGRESRSAGL
jgi:hypothetical protein